MFILYIDESGTEELKAQPDHFVLLGLMINAEDWKQLDQKIEKIKTKYALAGAEIHTAWMVRRYVEQDKIQDFEKLSKRKRIDEAKNQIKQRIAVLSLKNTKRVKSYRHQARVIEPYLHLSHKERMDCLSELADEIGSWSDARIFADAINKPAYHIDRMTPYEMAFEQVLTRYQAFLEKVKSSGIVVHDNNTTVAPRLTKLTRLYHKKGTLYREIQNIVETPLFVDSTLTDMIQMADICAYSLRRYIENGETLLWDKVKPRVDRLGGVDVGVRHYTGRRKCTCELCKAHGRGNSAKNREAKSSSSCTC